MIRINQFPKAKTEKEILSGTKTITVSAIAGRSFNFNTLFLKSDSVANIYSISEGSTVLFEGSISNQSIVLEKLRIPIDKGSSFTVTLGAGNTTSILLNYLVI